MEEKRWENENSKEKNIEEIIRKAGEQEPIPEGLKPENMKKFLEENTKPQKKRNVWKWHGAIAMAASLALVLFIGKNVLVMQDEIDKTENVKCADVASEETQEKSESQIEEYDTSYDDLYHFFQKQEKEREEFIRYSSWEAKGEVAAEESTEDLAMAESSQQSDVSSGAEEDYADTNKQEAGVDEADIIKNDGRYLYQIIYNQDYSQSVQIVDTKDGLKEVARIDGFENIFELYMWEDTLVVFESDWAEAAATDEEDAYYDIARTGTAFQKVYIYNIAERENPKEEHVFTMKGSYLDSRLTDGYLYCFLTCDVEKLEDRKQYVDYVPVLEEKAMEASSIYLPEEADAFSYVVMASIDLSNPKELEDTKAIVSSANRVYVTNSNIYIADSLGVEETEEKGSYSNKTNIYRFSYENGIMQKEAEGSVKGRLLDDMAINEYNGYLRMAVTVNSYQKEPVKDDILGIILGYDTIDTTQDNSLYILDEELKVVGKIEGLAEDEQIYSARFMGDTGYFVTFRQTDPLFSVDLSEPENPKILGELKISGFSEYLHFYSEDLLLGIGMEADEETGRTEGMKLSMFDISNPSDVTEQDKYSLSEYNYSDALYNYKAVMIDTEKNLFGFCAEGYDEEMIEDYLLFTYENGGFQQKMKISCNRDEDGIYVSVRGTYIGDVFYLMYGDGKIEAYSLVDGSMIEKLSE